MDFRGEHHGVIQVIDGCIRMGLGYLQPGAFTYKLQYLMGSAQSPQPALLPVRAADLTDAFQIKAGPERLPLKDFVLQETTRDALNFFIRLPSRGIYFLTIYAQVCLTFMSHFNTLERDQLCIQMFRRKLQINENLSEPRTLQMVLYFPKLVYYN